VTASASPLKPHGIFPLPTADETSRQKFVAALKSAAERRLTPELKVAYERRVKPAFVKAHARLPADRAEVRNALDQDAYVQVWNGVRRTIQALMWESSAQIVERQLPRMVSVSKAFTGAGGSLILDPELQLPNYISRVDVHRMPTGYYREVCPDDVSAGALYDVGVNLYTMGQLGQLNDAKGRTIIENFLRVELPDFAPRRLLDMGCAVGHSTLPYVDAYPDADVYAIDVGAPMLRYAHARAESLGKRVHFSQQSAEATTFPDKHFDLIVSHILLHEVSRQAQRNIFRESRRLLARGGVMVHAEYASFEGLDLFTQYLLDWDTRRNNEPCWGPMRDANLRQMAIEAGFDEQGIRVITVPTTRRVIGSNSNQDPTNQFYLLVGRRDV
jgi:ubiquinone/menaquinone biosynthesis C-methylase UbiE